MKPIIEVENLSKLYRIGARGTTTIRDSVEGFFKKVGWMKDPKWSHYQKKYSLQSDFSPEQQGPEPNTFWALKDVSFTVNQGEVVGIIGRNGAGKSTLLKILSRITEPTSGRATLRGRVASLLEVGTGFHPDLTGRENVYMNGAILGMRKWEIEKKFDEIVAFAEVEKFIDTPVKHYSSGMYVRLAFAVAAHLESEILLIDEVLAVGDIGFQKKCLGKIENVAKGGRTALFVSHNMQAVQYLCGRAILIKQGALISTGGARVLCGEFIQEMIGSNIETAKIEWGVSRAPGNEEVKLLKMSVKNNQGLSAAVSPTDSDIVIELTIFLHKSMKDLCVGFDLFDEFGNIVMRSYQTDVHIEQSKLETLGLNQLECTIPAGLLNAGFYKICPRISVHNSYWVVNEDIGITFKTILAHGVSPYWNVLTHAVRPGLIAPILNWRLLPHDK